MAAKSNALVRYEIPRPPVATERPSWLARAALALMPNRFKLDLATRNSRLFGVLVPAFWEAIGEPEIGGLSKEQQALTYERDYNVFTCVRAIAEDVSELPVKIKDRNGENVEKDRWPSIAPAPGVGKASLFEYPNPTQTWADLLFLLNMDMGIFNEFYVLNDVDGWWWMPAWRTRAVPDTEERVGGYEMNQQGQWKRFAKEEVIHLQTPGPRNVTTSLSSLQPLDTLLKNSERQGKYETSFWRNGTQLSGYLKTEQNLDPDQRDEELDEWKAAYGGTTNAYKTALLSGGVEYVQVGMSPVAAGLNEAKQEVRAAVFQIYNVPPVRVGDPTANWALAREQIANYFRTTIKHRKRRQETRFSLAVWPDGEYTIEFDTSGVHYLVVETIAKMESAMRLAGKPILSVNEARELVGTAPTDDDNDWIVNAETTDQKWNRYLRATQWRQSITQNETRANLTDASYPNGFAPHHDPDADEVSKPPAQFWPATAGGQAAIVEPDMLGQDPATATNQAAEGGERALTSRRGGVSWDDNDGTRRVLALAARAKRANHRDTLAREERICLDDVALPLLDRMRKANLAAVNAARSAQSEHLRKTGELRELTVSLPKPADFEEQLQLELRDYQTAAVQRVGDEEFETLKDQRRSMYAAIGIELRAVRQTEVVDEDEDEDVLDDLAAQSFDANSEQMLEFLAAREQQIVTVPETVQDQVREQVAQGIDRGSSTSEIANELESLFDTLNDTEAKRIAVTESGAAANTANDEAMRQVGTSEKAWIHSGNPPAPFGSGRINHIMNDREGEVPFEHVYSNGMRHPHQTGAPAGEVINCQCVHIATGFRDIGELIDEGF